MVEQLKSREADDLWVSLGNCDIQDSKIASLTEALTQNDTVTAVDLSRNSITATGAQVIRTGSIMSAGPYDASVRRVAWPFPSCANGCKAVFTISPIQSVGYMS